jgi:3-hydroxybutyryl-CoA dehydrogenase
MGVIGGGTMGVGIADLFAAAGVDVTLVEPDATQQTRARQRLDETGRVTIVPDLAALPAGLDLVVEAVPERLQLKRQVLAAAQERRPTVLASNTSALSIDALAAALSQPDAFLGMHFFNPARSMPLVELVRGSATSDHTLELARRAAELVGKQTIVVRDSPGFATSRLGLTLGLEAMRMLEEGVADAADIDRAMELGYRHPMGPLRLTDLIGLDVRLDIARYLAARLGPRFQPPRILIEKVAAGELGRKTGRGFYVWDS